MELIKKSMPALLAVALLAATQANANIISDLDMSVKKYDTAQNDLATLKETFTENNVSNSFTETPIFNSDDDAANCLCYKFLSWR